MNTQRDALNVIINHMKIKKDKKGQDEHNYYVSILLVNVLNSRQSVFEEVPTISLIVACTNDS